MMGWFRNRQSTKDHLVVSWSGQTLAYVLARGGSGQSHKVLKFGVENQSAGAGGLEEMVGRLKALGLGLEDFRTSVMLHPEQYQLLRIRTPPVAPDELRAAARFQIMKILDGPVDDVTIDVMRVGDGRSRGVGHPAGHLYVVAAKRAAIRSVLELSEAMRWTISVIDIQETAQRNLQNALVAREGQGRLDRAHAALMLLDPYFALLTVCVNGELFYTRRFNLPPGFAAGAWDETGTNGQPVPAPLTVSFDPGSDMPGERGDDEQASRFLLEVQRSLDLWDRIWTGLPLAGISLYAGARSADLSSWLTRQLGQSVQPMDVTAQFPGFAGKAMSEEAPCMPLLGLLLRTEHRPI